MGRREKNGDGKIISTYWQSEFVLFAFLRTEYYYPIRCERNKYIVRFKGLHNMHVALPEVLPYKNPYHDILTGSAANDRHTARP